MRLHHVAIVCTSKENADRFYIGILGLKQTKISKLDKDLSKQLFNIAKECQIILYSNENFTVEAFVAGPSTLETTSFTHLCLEVEDRDVFLRSCQAAGLEVNQVSKGDSLVTFVQDYDGNLFEIKELPK